MTALVYIAIAAVSILTARYADIRSGVRKRAVFWLLFLILLVPAALRQGTGNDYYRYTAFMHLVVSNAYVPTEWGFNALVRLIYGLCGYENYLLVFAVFSAVTICLFLEGIRREAVSFFASFGLFMLFGYYFNSYNTVRYYLALSAALIALGFIRRKQYVFFVLTVAAAALFHKSALVLLALYPVCMIRWKKAGVIAATAAGAVLSLFRSFWLSVLVRLYPSYEGTGFFAAARPGYASILRCLAVFLLALYVQRQCQRHCLRHCGTGSAIKEEGAESGNGESGTALYARMNYLALCIYVFGWFVPEISRIGHYLTITHIFYVPALLRALRAKDAAAARKAGLIVAAAAAVYFVLFLFKAWSPDISLLPYRTFLFHDMPDVIVE